MKRSGFTMVELIFVIVIIGILAATALPKFGGIKDRAKINTEISLFGSLDSAIIAEREFQYDDFNNYLVNWHEYADMNLTGDRTANYQTVNSEKKVLDKIVDKNDKLKIVGYAPITSTGTDNSTDGMFYDLIFITGEASDAQIGASYPLTATNEDIPGKPDKNDFWAFNTSTFDINITGTNINTTTVDAGTIKLIDVMGTSPIILNEPDVDADSISGTDYEVTPVN